MNNELNNGYNSQNIKNNQKNEKIPEQGNFSASPNNAIPTSNVPPTQNRLNSQGGLPPKNGLKQSNNGLNNPSNNVKNNANNGFNPNTNQVNRGNQIKNNPNLNRQNKINQAKQELVKQGAKAAANAVAGPAGGAAVEALSKTKAGQKALDTASNALSPKKFSPFSFFGKKKDKDKEEETAGEASIDMAKKVIGFGTFGSFGLSGCLTIVTILAIVAIIISPLFYINELISSAGEALSNFGEKLGNFLTFRGWCSDEECQEIEQNNFYDHINEVYEEYLDDKSVRLNATLLTATLTYGDPFTTLDDEEITSIEDLAPSNYIDFRKSDEKVDELATRMVSYCCYENGSEYAAPNGKHMCQISNHKDYDDIDYECPEDVYETINGVEVLVIDYSERYKLDIERYEEYLREDFVRKFYYDGKENEDVDNKVDDTVDEIFLRVAMYDDLTGNTGSSSNFTGNNSKVIILDCNNNTVIDEVSLYEYLQGVLYVEGFATGRSEEFLKVMAVAAKNYLYAANGATEDNIPTTLRIKSCAMNQIYCSVTEGCHNMEDGADDNHDTIASGPDSNGNYYRQPIINDTETMEKIKNAIDTTLNEFIIKDGKFVTTQYRASCSGTCDSSNNIMDQAKANEMIKNGSTYKELLNYFYDGDIQEVELMFAGYPLDLQYNNVTSAYGWRVHPINNCCRHHNGTDIGANYDANIYSIADGVVVTNTYDSSYGNYIVVGHGQLNGGHYEYYSLYAHQIRLSTLVAVGDTVKAGQQIGNVGSTGNSTGPHLHIEIYSYVDGRKVRQDPVEYFSGVELTGQVGGALYESESACNATGVGSCS